jgi:PKD repeat protein
MIMSNLINFGVINSEADEDGPIMWYAWQSRLICVKVNSDGLSADFTESPLIQDNGDPMPYTSFLSLTMLEDGSLLFATQEGSSKPFVSRLFHIEVPQSDGSTSYAKFLGIMSDDIGIEGLYTDALNRVYVMDTGSQHSSSSGNRLLRFTGDVTLGDFSYEVVSISQSVPDIDGMGPGIDKTTGWVVDTPGFAIDSLDLYKVDYDTGAFSYIAPNVGPYAIHAINGSEFSDGTSRLYTITGYPQTGGTTSTLYEIDPDTGATIRSLGSGPSGIGLTGGFPSGPGDEPDENDELVVDAGLDQTTYEGETVHFNGSYNYNATSNWHKLDVNYATDSALYLRTIDPGGPYLGAWEGGVMEWVTFSSPESFWIGKKAGHMGQGPAGKDYTYFWKMHTSGNFTFYVRAGNGWLTADIYDETAGTSVVFGLYAYQGSNTALRYLEKGHIYRLDVHSTGVLSGFPNDLDVIFRLEETDILLTPDLNSLVYYVSQSPLVLAKEGPGVTSITFFSRTEQEFYANYANVLYHSEDVMSGGELSLAPDPYKTGITPGEYTDTPLGPGDPKDLSMSWDFDANVDSDGDGNKTNDVEATGANPTHTYGDDGNYMVTLSVTDNLTLTATDTCNVTVLNVDPDVSIESATIDVEIGLRVAGSKWSNVGMSLFEDDNMMGYLEVERWPGNPDDNPQFVNGSLPTTLDMTKSYKAIVTYDPYPDSGDEINGDQPNNGKDKKDNAGNPVWIVFRFPNGSEERVHHTFNTQQSKIRDSDHPNHIDPWEVDLNAHLIGWEFEVDYHVTDPGSDDEILTFIYGSQNVDVTHLSNPPNPDPFPSPEVNPRDIIGTTNLVYEGAGTMDLVVKDDDNIRLGVGEGSDSIELV